MKSSDKKFYVYAYIRNEDDECCFAGTPYYIGKGKGNRVSEAKIQVVGSKGTGMRDLLPDFPQQMIILKDGLNERQALDLEIKLIAFYGRADKAEGCLFNLTNGGEGTVGRVVKDAERERSRQLLLGNDYGSRVDWSDPEIKAKHAEGLKRRKPYETTQARIQASENLEIPYNWKHPDKGEKLGISCKRMERETGFHQAGFWKVANGSQHQTHGWICLNPIKEFIAKPHDPERNIKGARTRNLKSSKELGLSIEEFEGMTPSQRSYRKRKIRLQQVSDASSPLNIPWRRARTRKEIWCEADKYYKLWMENDKCATKRMKTITGYDLEVLLQTFKSGWVPTKDADWIDWAKEIKLEYTRKDIGLGG